MDVPSIPCSEHSLQTGDRMLFYTDGITEREDSSGNMYEIDRLLGSLYAARLSSPQQMLHALVEDIARFAVGTEPADDQTLLLLALDRQQS